MPFRKFANGHLSQRNLSPDSWGNFLDDQRRHLVNGSRRTASQTPNLIAQASEILQEEFDPANYLLSHVTIVASVDTEEVPNIRTGSFTENGRRIVRKYSDYRITPDTDSWANNNGDSWARKTLLKSYSTFIGADNFCFTPDTRVMMADGTYRPIRDVVVGDSVVTHLGRARKVTHKFVRNYVGDLKEIYVDRFKRPILATPNHPFRGISVETPPLRAYAGSSSSSQARYRRDQVARALRGETSSFETRDVVLKRLVDLLETGPRTEREISDAGFSLKTVRSILRRETLFFGRRPLTSEERASRLPRARTAQVWGLLASAPKHLLRPFRAEKAWIAADAVAPDSFLLGPERTEGTRRCLDEATLLGYYAAEGCLLGSPTNARGFVLSFGPHEQELATHASELAAVLFEGASISVSPTQTTLRVEVHSRQAGEWAHRMAGHLAPNKRLDESVFSWDRESLLHLLGAWMSGDGNVHQETFRVRGTSTSENLANQMQRVAETAGVKACVVFERRKIGEVQSRVTMVVGGEPRAFDVIPRHHAWTVLVSKDSIHEVTTRGRRWGARLQRVREAQEKRDDLAWWGDCRAHRVAKVLTTPYAGEVFNIEVEDDHSYVVDHGVAVHNCEHVQIPEQSKGRIIDAVARDIGPSVYVDILVATNRKHESLIRDIKEGRMGTLSMGCSCLETTCTKCGNVAADETDLCDHIRYEKRNYFYDDQGKRRIIAELCGHPSIDPTAGITFIEASWVAVPAFKGAVLRNVLEPETISADTRRQATEVLSSPPREWVDDGTLKAARLLPPAVHPRTIVGGEDDVVEDAPEEAPEEDAEKDPLSALEDEVTQILLDRVKKRIKKQLDGDEGSPGELATSTGDGVIHQGRRVAKLAEGTSALLRIARSDVELIDAVARLEASFGVETSRDIYRTALRVGSTDSHKTLETYLARCAEVLDRRLTAREAGALKRLGRLLSLWKRT